MLATLLLALKITVCLVIAFIVVAISSGVKPQVSFDGLDVLVLLFATVFGLYTAT